MSEIRRIEHFLKMVQNVYSNLEVYNIIERNEVLYQVEEFCRVSKRLKSNEFFQNFNYNLLFTSEHFFHFEKEMKDIIGLIK